MVDTTFDRVSRFFAERRLSRRQALAAGGAGIATAVGLGAAGTQEATPVAKPVPETSDSGGQYLFVQSYASGAITPADDPDRYTVTLEGGVGQTVYFANRPSRDVGAGPTEQFLDGLGFREENPPNAALVLEVEPGD